ncbi:ComF family protein [Indioceanicola profundi]|uniref:ComF family protein n=1 Tax=Indioceanicola profundi TaxID=2220096 RepID=UPI000E6AB9A3|nr:ComF family protein [Indioceanicola profundi]
MMVWQRLAIRSGQLVSRALDLILPPRCLGCGADVGAPGTLCPACWKAAAFIAPPLCACCGLPFEFQTDGQSLCGACIARPPAFDRCRAVLVYDDASKGMVLRFKHADRTDAAPGFAAWMARAGADLLAEADLIVPVPLHRWRLFRRRYNQSALLALHLGRLSGRPVTPDLLVRKRPGTQGGQSARGRVRTVVGAFALPPAAREAVRGRRVLLVDDVFTTGATVGECAKVLKRAGAAGVDVLTLARVVRAQRLEPADGSAGQ